MKMVVINNTPTGTRRCVGFVERYDEKESGVEEWYEDSFSPEDLERSLNIRIARECNCLNLRQGADRLGISVVELSRIELGKARFADYENYEKALEILREERNE